MGVGGFDFFNVFLDVSGILFYFVGVIQGGFCSFGVEGSVIVEGYVFL